MKSGHLITSIRTLWSQSFLLNSSIHELDFPMPVSTYIILSGLSVWPRESTASSISFPRSQSQNVHSYLFGSIRGSSVRAKFVPYLTEPSFIAIPRPEDDTSSTFDFSEIFGESQGVSRSSVSETGSVDEELRDANRLSPSILQNHEEPGDIPRKDEEIRPMEFTEGVNIPALSKLDLALLRAVPIPQIETHEVSKQYSRSLPCASSTLMTLNRSDDLEIYMPAKSQYRGYNSDGET